MARLAERFPHVLSLVFDPDRAGRDAEQVSYARRLKGRSDQQIAEDFVSHVRAGRAADGGERHMLGEALAAARAESAGEGAAGSDAAEVADGPANGPDRANGVTGEGTGARAEARG